VKESKLTTDIWVDISVKDLPVGSFVQFERRCYARLDKKYFNDDGLLVMDFIFIPDGKSKGMSNIKNKIDAAQFAKGSKEVKPQEPAPATEIDPEKKPKGEKKIDEAIKAQKMKEKAEKLAQEKAAKEAGTQDKKDDKPADATQGSTSGTAEQK
jgi:hypothetical protein